MNISHINAGCYRHHPIQARIALHMLRPDPRPDKNSTSPDEMPQDDTSAATEDAIVCRQCLNVITSSSERKVVNGAHAHTFANPEGIVFEISCYRDAWGCGYVGPASPEFTWFAGYLWRIAICGNCHAHLGWRFTAPDGLFFHGLITSQIIARDI